MSYFKTILSNGLTVISYPMPSVRSVSLGLWFRVGSRDENSQQAGLTHFMEHMMFKGTSTKGPLDISMHFDKLGAEFNAFTSKEYTCYYARFVDDKLEDALSMLAEMVIDSTFTQEAIDTEREVVIEEIARSEDTPDDYVFELYNSSTFPQHPLGLPVLGTRERVGTYTHDDCVNFHQEFYHAGNLVVAAAGNLDHDNLVKLVNDYFSHMKSGVQTARKLSVPAFSAGVHSAQRETEQAHLLYGFPWYGVGDERRYVGSVLTTLLGGSMSSRLFQEIREKRGLAYSVYATQACYQGAGQWCIYAGTRKENISEVLTLIETELERIRTQTVDDEELQRTIDFICGQLLLGLETTNSHMARLGKREVLGLDQVTPEEQVKAYRAVTSKQIQELAQDFLHGDPGIALVSSCTSEDVPFLLNSKKK